MPKKSKTNTQTYVYNFKKFTKFIIIIHLVHEQVNDWLHMYGIFKIFISNN